MNRKCLWCGTSIAHMSPRALYCCPQHKKNAASARHRERNPGYYKRYAQCERFLQWRKDKAPQLRAKSREWAAKNPEKVAAQAKRFREANRVQLQVRQRARRAAELNNAGSVGVSVRDWLRLCERYRYRCAYCGSRGDLQMDHVIPLSRGGRHAIGNILPACRSCNGSKNARFYVEWKYRQAYRLMDEILADQGSDELCRILHLA